MKPITLNNLEIRLAESEAEVVAAQRLRYRVFYDEMGATPSPEVAARGCDCDDFDPLCDHLIVLDTERPADGNHVVACYRLLRRSVVEANDRRFYSEDEFDVGPLRRYPGEVVELGRSCVDIDYRTRSAMQLLWSGLAAYVFLHDIAVMFGCASLHGTDLDALMPMLSYLHHSHLAPEELRPRALPEHYVDIGGVPREAIDPRAVLAELPPLIKGYLRVGGFIGDGAFVDRQFNTTDVCIIVKTDMVTQKYLRHYQKQAGQG